LLKIQSPSPNKVEKINKIQLFQQQKLRNSFPLTQSKSGPDPNFMKQFTSRIQSKTNKFVIVRFQSNPCPVQCSFLEISPLKLFHFSPWNSPEIV